MQKQISFVLCSLVFLFGITFVFGQASSCGDCSIITNCEPAFRIVNSATKSKQDLEKLKNAFCGHSGKVPKVCCVDFHPNLSLLPQSCGFINGDRIIGGREANLGEYPWMTLISYTTREGPQFKCGGSIINERYILTAAHCLADKKIAGVRVGEHDISSEQDCQGKPPKVKCQNSVQDIQIEEIIPHPNYVGRPSVRNDIGLLRLDRPITFTTGSPVQPICLPVTAALRSRNLGNGNGTIAGWGYTETGYASLKLLSANVPVYPEERCKSIFSKAGPDETKNKLCAGANGKDSCGGDSGGPLMLQGKHSSLSRYIQYGIVSYGPKLCGSSFPGVYTDISKYMDWILDNMKP